MKYPEEKKLLAASDGPVMTIYRATDDGSEREIRKFSSWTPEEETAKAYQDNPGFGGQFIRSETVRQGKILDADTTSRKGMRALAERLGFGAQKGEEWFDSGWRYPWQESKQVRAALEGAGYDWIRYPDDFPEGATTIVALQERLCRKPG